MGTLIDRVLADGHIRNDQERAEVWDAIVAFEHAEADRAEAAYLAEQVRLADEADAAFEKRWSGSLTTPNPGSKPPANDRPSPPPVWLPFPSPPAEREPPRPRKRNR